MKHTDFIPSSLGVPVCVRVVVVHLSHAGHPRLADGCPAARAHGSRGGHPCRTTRTGHVAGVGGLGRLSVVHLCHAADSSTSQAGVLVAVPPTVDRSLDETSLTPKRGVQLCEGPTNRVALGLVLQAVAAVLILRAARPRINTVLRLEFCGEFIRVHGLDITSDGVFHLYAVARILKRDPLNTVLILPHYERGGGGDWSWRGVGIGARCRTGRG